ncbi:MAG: hypothetical protein FWE57_03945 [Chitinispirillia bacterium]|nr:hypothetical protein [Chitinispirillia bacterium]
MSRLKILWTACIFILAGFLILGCSDPKDTTGPGGNDDPPRENVVGKANDGADVLVFMEGELDEYLTEFEINVSPEWSLSKSANDNTGCNVSLWFMGLRRNKIPKVGDIWATEPTKKAPDGFLIKVLRVNTVYRGGNLYDVHVTGRCADLEEAIEDVDFEEEVELEFDEDGELIEGLQKTNKSVSKTFNADRTVNLGAGDQMKAEVAYTVKFTFKIKISKFSISSTEISVEQKGNAELSGTVNRNINTRFMLDEVNLPRIRFWVGFIPVTFRNSIETSLRVHSQGEVDMRASYKFGINGKYGVEYRNKSWNTINVNNHSLNLDVDHHINGSVRVGVLLGLTSRLYGIVGLGFHAGPVLNLSVDGVPASGTHVFDNGFQHNYLSGNRANAATLDLDINIYGDITLRVLGRGLSYPIVNRYYNVSTLNQSSFLPAFSNPSITANGSNEINVNVSLNRSILSYPVRDFGICVEKADSDECAAGGGMRKTSGSPVSASSAIWQWHNFSADFKDMEPGIYNVRPFFESGKGTFYEKAAVYAPRYTLWVGQTFLSGQGNATTVTPRGEQRGIVVGTQIDITAEPEPGFVFVKWQMNAGGDISTIADTNAAATTVTVNANTSIQAVFELLPSYSLNMVRSPNVGAVTPSPTTTHRVFEGAQPIPITAAPSSRYVFVNWTVEGDGVIAEPDNPITTVTVSGNTIVTANFESIRLTINQNPAVGGVVTTNPEWRSSIPAGTEFNIIAAPMNGYVFVNWTIEGGGTIADANAASTSIIVNTSTTVTANFQLVYTLRVNPNSTVGGTVNPSSLQTDIVPGTEIPITAIPASGWVFDNWTMTGDGSTITNSNTAATSVTVNANTVVTANFRQTAFMLTVNQNSIAGGSTVTAIQQTGIAPGTQINITATPANGWAFVNWTVVGGGIVTDINAASTSVTVNTNTTVTANFHQPDAPPHDTFTDPRDNQVYRTVIINHRTWMAENLNFQTDDSYCYDNNLSNCNAYGRLYDWDAAMKACPVGWSLPTSQNWKDLIFLANSSSGGMAARSLKSTSGWNVSTNDQGFYNDDGLPDGNGTDDYGFSALPGGALSHIREFNGIGSIGFWWGATTVNEVSAYSPRMTSNSISWVGEISSIKNAWYSVRCIQD